MTTDAPRDGFWIATGTDGQRALYALVNGSPISLEMPPQLADKEPGYYDTEMSLLVLESEIRGGSR